MKKLLFSLLKRAVPTKVKNFIINRVRAIARETHVEGWVENAIIPLDQKIVRLEAELLRLEVELSSKALISKKIVKEKPVNNEPKIQLTDNLREKKYHKGLLTDEEYYGFQGAFHQGFAALDEDYKSTILSYAVGAKNVVEVGCGTGSLLYFLKENDSEIEVLGVDTNQYMIDKLVEKGVTGVCDDAVSALSGMASNTQDVIFAMHIIEHLSSTYLRDLIEHAYRVLRPGGKLVVETPNIQSLYVLSYYYFADPTHENPRHPSLYAYVMKSVGFEDTVIDFVGLPPEDLTLHKFKNKDNQEQLERINQMIFSSGNNVIIKATK